ncbi:MAG: efflux RND transporter periplasmic adaptor subunit [Nitrospiria bacterium]
MKSRTRWVGIAVSIIAIGILAWGASYYRKGTMPQRPGVGPPHAMPVEAARVHVDTLPMEVSAVGSLQANESVVIRSEITGRVKALHFSEGQNIDKGSILLSIDSAEYLAQLEQISATVELNELNYERAKPLYQEKLISQQAYEEIAAKLKESQANLSLAQARLDKTTIRAPFRGRLGLRQVSPGDYLQPGQAIVNLEDIDSLKVDFRIPEIYSGQVKTGQAVNVHVDAFPNKSFVGKTYAIDPRIDEATRTILLRAHIANPGGVLRPGMFARVTLALGQRTNALLIPEQALVPMGEDKFVFRIVEDKAVLTRVKIGQHIDAEVEIMEGLRPDDTVVTAGQTKIYEGAPVTMIDPAGVKPETAPTQRE